MVESATGSSSFLICAPLWRSYGIPPLCTCFLIGKNEEGLTFFSLMSSPCGLNEEQIQAESLDCENDTLTNIPSHQIRFFRVFCSLAFVRYGC